MAATLRDLQLCELGILKDIKRVCEEHNITYYLSSGTLLGAVRHQGFIPWDDDIDIEMPYPDYLRFMKIAQSALGDGYFVQTMDTDPHFNSLFIKVRKNNTALIEEYTDDLEGHHGVWVDVFPLIYIGGKLDLVLRRTSVRISNFLTMDEKRFQKNREWLKSSGSAALLFFIKVLRRLPLSTRKRIRKLLTKLIFRYRPKHRMAHVWNNITYIHQASSFSNADSKLYFENELFPVPSGYREYLHDAYGDYMQLPPEEKRNGGHGNVVIDLEHSWEYLQQHRASEQTAMSASGN